MYFELCHYYLISFNFIQIHSDGTIYWTLNGIVFLVLFIILAIIWFKKLWVLLSPVNEDEPRRIDLPQNQLLRLLFKMSKAMVCSAFTRFVIYFMCVCVLISSALIHLVECDAIEQKKSYEEIDSAKYSPCLNTWVSYLCPAAHACECGQFELSSLDFFLPGDNTKFNIGAVHEFSLRAHRFPRQTACGRSHCGRIFMGYFWTI